MESRDPLDSQFENTSQPMPAQAEYQAQPHHDTSYAVQVAPAEDQFNPNPFRAKASEQDSDQEKPPSIAKSKTISSDHGRTGHNLTFPTSFKLDAEYSSPEQITRILRREEVQMGLPLRFMKEINSNRNESNQNIIIKCRTCRAYLDFRCVNGKYMVAVLRNRHTHDKPVKTTHGNKEGEPKKQMIATKFRPPVSAFSSSNFCSVKSEAGVNSSLKSYIENLRTIAAPPVAPPGRPLSKDPIINIPRLDNLLGMPSAAPPQQSRIMVSKFKQMEDYLVSEGYELIVDQGRQPAGAYPQIIMAVSPTMKRNFQRFGDLVSFHIVQIPILETSENGHNYRLGVFNVYSYNRKQLLAGVTFLCRQTAAATRTVFQFFLKLHGKQPESISTNHEKEVCLAISQLQDDGAFSGIHMVDSQQALQSLEAGFKVRNKLTREIIDLCTKVVSERNRSIADKIIRDIQELIEAQDEHTQKATLEFLNQKEKIFVSSLPAAFLGIFDTSYMNRQFDDLLCKKIGVDKVDSIDNITKLLVEIDGSLLDQSFDKIIIYQDPIEGVFDDNRIKVVRESLDAGVFKIFLQNYTEAMCFMQIKPTEEGESPDTVYVTNIRSCETFKLFNWTCTCDETKRTGLPCAHLLSVAIETREVNYIQLIKERWRQCEVTECESEQNENESQNIDELQPANTDKPSEEKPSDIVKEDKEAPAIEVNNDAEIKINESCNEINMSNKAEGAVENYTDTSNGFEVKFREQPALIETEEHIESTSMMILE